VKDQNHLRYELFPSAERVPGGRRGYVTCLDAKGPDEVVLTLGTEEALALAILLLRMVEANRDDTFQVGLCGELECDHDIAEDKAAREGAARSSSASGRRRVVG
jgi:hypothetical protein